MVTMTEVIKALRKVKGKKTGGRIGGTNYETLKKRVLLLAEVLDPEEKQLIKSKI